MGAFSTYSFCAGIYLLAAYLIYKWLLSGENQPAFNRILLLSLYVVAFILPKYQWVSPSVEVAGPQIQADIDLGPLTVGTIDASTPQWMSVVMWVYLAGMIAAFFFSIISFVSLLSVIRKGRKCKVGQYTLVILSDTRLAPFSWMRYIVMSEADYAAAGDMIICHETSHLRLYHWADLLLAQIVCVILWYNPASWLMRAELRSVHEYQADSSVLSCGTNAREYQLLLIKKAVGQRFPSLANSLNHSKLKNRITMMCNQPSSPVRRLRALAIAPALIIAAVAVNLPLVSSALTTASLVSLVADKVSEKTTNGQIVAIVDVPAEVAEEEPDVMPEYPGGSAEMYKFVGMNVRYPEKAMQNDVQGRVVVGFIIDKDGKPVDISIIKSVDPELDAEAMRVAGMMPAWKPATKDGKPVRCKMAMPVAFKLQGDSPKKQNADVHELDETVVVAYGSVKKKDSKKTFTISSTGNSEDRPDIKIDGKLFTGDLNSINPENIESISVSKDLKEHPNGLIEITMKK